MRGSAPRLAETGSPGVIARSGAFKLIKPSGATKCAPSGACNASRPRNRRSCLPQNAARPSTTAGFARMVERAGEAAKLAFKAHPHMLRHACGFALANKGHDTRALQAYLGHKNIQHTVRY